MADLNYNNPIHVRIAKVGWFLSEQNPGWAGTVNAQFQVELMVKANGGSLLAKHEAAMHVAWGGMVAQDELAAVADQEWQSAELMWGKRTDCCDCAIPLEYAGREDEFYCLCAEEDLGWDI